MFYFILLNPKLKYARTKFFFHLFKGGVINFFFFWIPEKLETDVLIKVYEKSTN